jgi:predicted transcriptional regulator
MSKSTPFHAMLGDILERLNVRRGDLAVKVDVSPALISQLLAGKARPMPTVVYDIVDALRLDGAERDALLQAAALAYLPERYREAIA